MVIFGRRGNGFIVRFMEGDVDFEFFILFECDYIFNNREEIFILEVIVYYLYFLDIIKYI